MERIILHCDLNSFYASVELLSHPDLRDVPMAVCGNPASRHGIILAKNEPAKAFKIATAETIWQAKKKCPNLVLLSPHHTLYKEYSIKVNAIYGRYTDLVEPFGIDESWLDITGTAHLFGGNPRAIADHIRHAVKEELGLTVSVGVSFNKIFAKLGSDYKKPDATTVIDRDNWQTIVSALPVGDLLYVGHAARKILGQYGIETIGQLAQAPLEMLEAVLGKMGHQLHTYANGLDDAPVVGAADRAPIKSVGNGTTFPRNLTTTAQVRSGVALLCDTVATRLRQYQFYAGGVQVTIRDPQFKNRSRQCQLSAPTHLMRELTEQAMMLIDTLWSPPQPLRAITITAIHLTPEGQAFEQVNLFSQAAAPQSKRNEALEQTMDTIRGKFGTSAIQFGITAPHEKQEDPFP
ncbi:DNA polymerase IV [Bengtsoniella intestinalis]|uniref:DNA polymerase Y family protein n=1 Tax=Bengtsoniella intestinalis TaxID=3073143 RepID=UPI00391EE52B